MILKVSRDGFRGGYSVTDEIRWEACVPGHFELRDYFPILLMLVFSAGFAVTQVLMSQFVGQQKRTRTKLMPYECGKDPVGSARERFSVKFYLIAMIFILFDIEVIFLIPWAVVFRSFSIAGAGSLVYVEMMLFIVFLLVGYVYVVRKGAFDWGDRARIEAEAEGRALEDARQHSLTETRRAA